MTSGHGWESGTRTGDDKSGSEEPQVIVRDRRRIDPESGQVRTAPGASTSATGGTAPPPEAAAPAASAASAASAAPAEAAAPPADTELVTSLRAQVAERTSDLQRLKAEYDNYRRRVDRDRQLVAEQAVGRLLGSLLPTLDDIGRARDHGDLEGPFKAVAEALETTLESAGLERYGSMGEAFDPLVHDALMHSYRPDVAEPTCVEVFRAGYRYAGRVLRAAQVVVAEPPPASEEPPAPPPPPESDLPAASGWESTSAPGEEGSEPRPEDGPTIHVD